MLSAHAQAIGAKDGFDAVERGKVLGHIINEGYAILFQDRRTADAIRQEDRVVGGADSHHVEKVPGQGNKLQLSREGGRRAIRNLALLRHEELAPQLLKRIAAIQERGLQDGMPGKIPLYPARKYRATGLLLNILISTDMVGIAMRIDDALDAPSVLPDNLQNLLRGLLVVAAVDEIDLVVRLPIYANLRRAVDVVALRTYLI